MTDHWWECGCDECLGPGVAMAGMGVAMAGMGVTKPDTEPAGAAKARPSKWTRRKPARRWCASGRHLLTPDNQRRTSDGYRRCKACQVEHQRRYDAERRKMGERHRRRDEQPEAAE